MTIMQAPVHAVLDGIQHLFSKMEGKGFDAGLQEDCKKEIQLLADFFNCKEEEAVLLSILVQLHYNQATPSIGAVLDHLDVKASAAVYFNELLQVFVERDWLYPRSNVLSFPKTEYELNINMIHCITKNDWSYLEKKIVIPKNSLELLDLFQQEMCVQKKKKRNILAMTDICIALLNSCPNTSLSRFIKKEKIAKADIPFFLKICSNFYEGKENIYVNELAQEFVLQSQEKYKLTRSFQQETHPFFKKGLLEKITYDFPVYDEQYIYSNKLIHAIDPKAEVKPNAEKKRMLEQIQPRKITEKHLIFESVLQSSVEKLHTMLMPEHYDSLMQRFRQKGMKAGVTVLIYGSPGTGKTETILQMSRQTGRSILMADASKIRDKWVGETEKNIRSLFSEYKKCMKENSVCPILLFNEADAVFGKRRPVTDRVDQMENSLQNILLEELENFEGIFIATTNMEANFDKAFDRRFLYKLKFEVPTSEANKAIWQNKFPDLEMHQIEALVNVYTLTGAQIENIRKKVEVDSLLDNEFKPDLTYLKKMALEELNFQSQNSNRNSIGFIRGKNILS